MATGKTEIRQVRISKGSIVPIGDYFNTAVLIQVDVVDQETGWASSPSKAKRLMMVKTIQSIPVQPAVPETGDNGHEGVTRESRGSQSGTTSVQSALTVHT